MWKAIPEYEGFYEVAMDGQVRRICSTAICHRRLSEAQVENVWLLVGAGKSQRSIAKAYGVSPTVIKRIANGTAYQEYSPQLLKPALDTKGYPFVALCRDGKVRLRRTHDLVAVTFIGPRPSPKTQVNHKDGDRQNPHLDNLEYVTPSGNELHSIDVLGKKSKLSSDDAMAIMKLKGIKTQKDIAKLFGVSVPLVSNIWRGLAWARYTKTLRSQAVPPRSEYTL